MNMMKKVGSMKASRAGVLLSVWSLWGAGCESLRTIEIPAETTIEVPGTAGLGGNPLAPEQVFPADVLGQLLSEALQQSFSTEGVDKDAVDSLTLTQLDMFVDDPDEAGRQVRDLGFLSSLTVSASAENADALVVAESAEGVFATSPAPTSYVMPLTGAELKPLLDASDAINLGADMVPSNTPPNFATEVRFVSELTVVVNVVGALNGGP
jgi:hypothetical protein